MCTPKSNGLSSFARTVSGHLGAHTPISDTPKYRIVVFLTHCIRLFIPITNNRLKNPHCSLYFDCLFLHSLRRQQSSETSWLFQPRALKTAKKINITVINVKVRLNKGKNEVQTSNSNFVAWILNSFPEIGKAEPEFPTWTVGYCKCQVVQCQETMLNNGFVWLSKVQKLGFCGSMVSENT